MKIIVDKKDKKNLNYHVKNSLRNILIIFSYIVGFSLYSLIYMVWPTKDLCSISYWWIAIPMIGLVTGLLHMLFIYKGSLFCKGIIMFEIMIYVFLLPLIIALVK